MSRWVTNASPLLLRTAASEVLVPPAVLKEVLAQPDEASEQIRSASRTWLRSQIPGRSEEVELLEIEIGPGEAEAITLAREVRADRIVLDDLDARRKARLLGLKPVGTLGLLLAARLRGELPSMKAEIEKLLQFGFRVSDSLVEAILKEAGE